MYEQKTKINDTNVLQFIGQVDDKKQADAFALLELIQEVTNEEPKMWGTSIIGFGSYHYKYKTGHEGDAPLVGFSPRKANFTIYLNLMSVDESNQELVEKLGKCKTGKGCLYINKLSDVDQEVLKQLIKKNYEDLKSYVW